MEAMLAIKIVREIRINEIRPNYLKTSYLNVSALTIYQREIGFSQSCNAGTTPPENISAANAERRSATGRQTLGHPLFPMHRILLS